MQTRGQRLSPTCHLILQVYFLLFNFINENGTQKIRKTKKNRHLDQKHNKQLYYRDDAKILKIINGTDEQSVAQRKTYVCVHVPATTSDNRKALCFVYTLQALFAYEVLSKIRQIIVVEGYKKCSIRIVLRVDDIMFYFLELTVTQKKVRELFGLPNSDRDRVVNKNQLFTFGECFFWHYFLVSRCAK